MVAVAERGLMRRGADVFESRRILASALIAPAVIFIVLLVGTPFVLAIYLSFTDATAGSLSGSWVGLHNFSTAWHDPIFRHALRNTAVMTLLSQAIVVVCAAILSNYLARPFRGRWFLRFLILLPWAAPVALGAITWLWIFDGLYSVVNWTLVHAGLIGPACGLLHQWPFHVGECTSLNTPQWLGQENRDLVQVGAAEGGNGIRDVHIRAARLARLVSGGRQFRDDRQGSLGNPRTYGKPAG